MISELLRALAWYAIVKASGDDMILLAYGVPFGSFRGHDVAWLCHALQTHGQK